mgnify:CR=1 FL=1
MQQSLRDLGIEQLDLVLMHWPEAWLPSSDMDKGNIHPDTSITLLETWWVGLKLDWACVGLVFCLLGKLFLVRQRECTLLAHALA